MRRLIRTWPGVALVAVIVLATGGVAYATWGNGFIGPHGYINTCVPKRGGEVNVWKPGHRCTGGRVGLAFPANTQAGAKGPAGPAGPTGMTGATGATGATGPSNPSATTVDGETVTKLMLKIPTPASGTATVTLYGNDGLTVVAACDHTGTASVAANGPASADSELTVSGYQSGTTPTAFGSETDTLGPSSGAALGPAGSGESSFSYASSAGAVVTGEIGYQSATSFSSYAGCAFFGTATSG